MKKILSFLFILSFTIIPVKAPGQKRLTRVIEALTNPRFGQRIPQGWGIHQRWRIPQGWGIPLKLKINQQGELKDQGQKVHTQWLATPGHELYGPDPSTMPGEFTDPALIYDLIPGHELYGPDPSTMPGEFTDPALNYDLMTSPANNDHSDLDRGFIPEIHLSTSQEQQKFTIESNEEGVSSPHIVIPPKVKLDKIRMKVMMKQNRLNKAEMITDEFIFISLLIYHNEYREFCITDYAA